MVTCPVCNSKLKTMFYNLRKGDKFIRKRIENRGYCVKCDAICSIVSEGDMNGSVRRDRKKEGRA